MCNSKGNTGVSSEIVFVPGGARMGGIGGWGGFRGASRKRLGTTGRKKLYFFSIPLFLTVRESMLAFWTDHNPNKDKDNLFYKKKRRRRKEK